MIIVFAAYTHELIISLPSVLDCVDSKTVPNYPFEHVPFLLTLSQPVNKCQLVKSKE